MTDTHIYRNALPAGATLLEYRVESVLGAGGFGITYLCRDIHLDKRVAVKEYFPTDFVVRALDGAVLPVNSDSAGQYRWGLERFIQEARTLAKFSHPHIVRVNRYFEANATGYMVMDFEDGQSLHQQLKGGQRLDEGETLQVMSPLLDGLQAVHDTGFLHRDIKPSNIFIRASGKPVLLDFGSARQAGGGVTQSLTSIVTPGFAPLEQYSTDGNQGPWTDIYALGGVLYRTLSGENPPDAISRLKSDTVPKRLAPLRGRVSQPALEALEWALALDEKIRPQTVGEWRRVLEGGGHRVRGGVALHPSGQGGGGAVSGARALAARPGPMPDGRSRPITVNARTIANTTPLAPERRPLWQWFVGGAFVAAVLAGANQWRLRNQAQEQAALQAAQAQQAAQMQARAAEQEAAVREREAAVREKEQRASEREAALRRQEPTSPGVEPRLPEATRAPAQSVPFIPPEPSPRPAALPPPGQAGLEDARRRDPLAAVKEANFRRFDVNRDGFLTPDEVRGMPKLGDDFRQIDTNRDGRISLDEFFDYRPFQPPGQGGALPPKR